MFMLGSRGGGVKPRPRSSGDLNWSRPAPSPAPPRAGPMNRPIAARPAAPARAPLRGRSTVTPPIARTVRRPHARSPPTALRTEQRMAGRLAGRRPDRARNEVVDGRRRRRSASATVCTERPITNPGDDRSNRGCRQRIAAQVHARGAPDASATSTRSLTRTRVRVPVSRPRRRRPRAARSAASRSPSRICTTSIPASTAWRACQSTALTHQHPVACARELAAIGDEVENHGPISVSAGSASGWSRRPRTQNTGTISANPANRFTKPRPLMPPRTKVRDDERPECRPRLREVVALPETRPGQDDEQQAHFDEERYAQQAAEKQSPTLASAPWRADRRGR